ncbi:MAG: hypothetical protein NTY38_20180, partial [Acidobacteria bacterium]|nr:hypothetical protein [Acidobacteriota bacterium]
ELRWASGIYLRQTPSRLATRLAAFLSERYPGTEEADSPEFLASLERQLHKAQDYGLETDYERAVYVTVAFLLGEGFDSEFPAAAELLPNLALPSSAKTEWLLDWCSRMFAELEAEHL